MKSKRYKIKKKGYKSKYQYLQNGGKYEFPVDGNPNSMTISGNENYSLGQSQNQNGNIDAGAVTDSISGGASMLGSLVSSGAHEKTGKVKKDAYTGGEALKGLGTGMQLGSAFGPWGTLIGGVIGGAGGAIYGAVESDRINKEAHDRMVAEKLRENMRIQNRSQSILSNYPTHGIVGNEFYQKYGGKISYQNGGNLVNPIQMNGMPPVLDGGQLNQTSSNTSTADGKEHSEGGIQLPNAEIEDKEVLRDDGNGDIDVYSDKLYYKPGITFAQAADTISKKKGKLEEKLSSNSIFAKNTAKRQIENLDKDLQELHAAQESMKDVNNIPDNSRMENGGTYKKSYASPIEKVVPYASNIANSIITAQTPEIPAPVYDTAMPLKTTYNIAPQLTEQRNQLSNLTNVLERNTSSSSDFRGNVIAATLGNINNTNKLMGQKENIETQLTNQNRLNTQRIDASNVAKENLYNTQKMHRIDDIHQRISKNVADASNKAQLQIAQQNQYELDLAKLDLLKKQYSETGVWDRNIESTVSNYLDGKVDEKEFVKAMGKLGKHAKNIAEKVKKDFKSIGLKSKAKKGREKSIEEEENQIFKHSIMLGQDVITPHNKTYNPSVVRPHKLNDMELHERRKRGLPPFVSPNDGINVPPYIPNYR